MPTIESTLYYADWCGHCKVFEPLWKHFEQDIKTNYDGKVNGINVILNSYEQKELNYKPTINGKDIQGYPTVKFKIIGDDGTSVEYEYTGKRTEQSLMDHIKNHALNNLKNKK